MKCQPPTIISHGNLGPGQQPKFVYLDQMYLGQIRISAKWYLSQMARDSHRSGQQPKHKIYLRIMWAAGDHSPLLLYIMLVTAFLLDYCQPLYSLA